MIFKTRKYLIERLKEEGLTSNRLSLDALENSGVLPKPDNSVELFDNSHFGNNMMRIYTNEEIEKIVQVMKEYTKNK